MALDWNRLVESHTLDQLYKHFGLSERALVHCMEHGLGTVRRIRHALLLEDAALTIDGDTHKELTELLAAHAPPPRKERWPPPPKPTASTPSSKKQRAAQHQWPSLPAEVRDRIVNEPDLDVRLLMAHLSPRAQRALAGYLAPEYAVADLDKLVFSNLPFTKFRDIGPTSVGELDQWRMELRHLRAVAQSAQRGVVAQGGS